MPSIIQILLFSIASIIVYLLSLYLGLLLYNTKLENKTKSYALNSFLGIISILCLYSFSQVGLKTMNLLAFIVLMYFFYSNKTRVTFEKIALKDLVPVLYIFPLVFLVYGVFNLPESIENDVRYYAKIAYSLGKFKQENFYHFYNTYDTSFNGLTPYHYTELWLSSLIAKIFGIKSIISLRYCTYPFLISAVCYGVLGFVNKNKFILFVLFLGLSILPLYSYISKANTGYLVYTDFWLRPNFVVYYYGLLPLFYLIYERKWQDMIGIGIIVGTFSIVLVPCLYAGLFMMLVYAMFEKQISFRSGVILVSTLLASCLFIFVLFKLCSPVVNVLGNQSMKEVLLATVKLWKPVLFISSALILECSSLILFSYLITKYLLKDTAYKPLYLFILVQVLTGVCLFQALNQMDNTYQFPYVAYAASGFICIVSLVVVISRIEKKILKCSISILLIIFCFYSSAAYFSPAYLTKNLEENNLLKNHVSKEWIARVNTYLNLNKTAKGGFILSKEDLKDLAPKSRGCLTYQIGSFICYMTDDCDLQSLTCRDTLFSDKNKDNEVEFLKSEAWIKIYQKYTIKCNVANYLKDNSIDYFICTKNKVIEDSSLIVYTDDKSDYKFVYKKNSDI
jgi:hypothetical protein